MNNDAWFLLKDPGDVLSPALLFYPERIRENIRMMIAIAGGPDRLWPHVKTHKNAEIIGLQQEAGIERFKCSTLSEALLLGGCHVKEALLAMQPTSIHIDKLLEIRKLFPKTGFSTLVDNEETLRMISERAKSSGQGIRLWLDVNNGMNRTGIVPGPGAIELFKKMNSDPWIECMGFHVYDGHIRDTDLKVREERALEAMAPVKDMISELASLGIKIENVIAGGSPSFPVHAKNPDLYLSPGTTLLWDAGYGKICPDLPFKQAAVLFTRVISKPAPDILTSDLGHKSVASEMPFPRIELLNRTDCEQISQSEEHLVLRCPEQVSVAVGEVFYALPVHVCPTVSKYAVAHVVENNELKGTWRISARDHHIELTH